MDVDRAAPPAADRPVVCVLAAPERELAACLESVRAHTPGDVRVVVAERGAAEVAAQAGRAGVAVCDGRHRVVAGWLDALQDAARDATVATSSALTLGAGPTALDVAAAGEAAAAELRGRSARIRPRLPGPAPACHLVTRAALDVAGPLDDGFADRCTHAGLLHVAADELLVLPVAGTAPEARGADGTLMEEVAARRAAPEPLDRALLAGRRAAEGLSATIDARILHGATAGTQVHTRELIAALHRTGALRMRVLLSPDVGGDELARLEALEGVERVAAGALGPGTRPSLIVHRPYQVSSAGDLPTLRAVGHRLVVTHQDLLAYHNPAYHPDAATWSEQRRLTRAALGLADAVVVFSGHAARDLAAEDLAPAGRVHEVPCGTDHLAAADPGAAPAGLAALAGRPFLLCLGTDLRHKNRPFALDVLAALRRRGWDGGLVLAGPHMPHGSSAADERARRAADAQLPVVDLGAIDEPAKALLYRDAAAVLYPTLSEGFGLIPFEAAAAGTPPLFASVSSLADLLPAAAARLVPWDAEASAGRALALLRDPAAAAEQVALVRAAGERFTWDRAAAALVGVYEAVVAGPAREAAALGWTAFEAEARRAEAVDAYYRLERAISPTGRSLVGGDGLLDEQGQRALAGLLRRRVSGPPTRAVLRLLGRAVRAGGARAPR